MQYFDNRNRLSGHRGTGAAKQFWRLHWGRILACLAGTAVVAWSAQPARQAPPGMFVKQDITPSQGNTLPDANSQMKMRDQQAKQQNFAAANAERKKLIAEDSARLLKLATDLKAEVDKTTKDTLSLNVIRRADEIERLAHNVKEKMKLTMVRR